VQQLHKDVRPATMSRRAWTDSVFARASLRDSAGVEMWYLAEHFLLAWHDWHTLQERFRGYFGESEKPFPTAWRRLDANCSALAGRLLRDPDLDKRVFKYWLTADPVAGARQEKVPSLREVYQAVVQNHRRWLLVRDAERGRLDSRSSESEERGSPGEIWPECRRVVVRLNEQTRWVADKLGEVLGRDLLVHLRHYRHANLLVSWLTDGSSADALDDGSALFQLLSEKIVIPSFEPYLNQLQDANVRGTAGQVLERVVEAIAEIGYADFIEDLSSSDFHGGTDSLVGASAINVIPSQTRGPCHSLLLAVSQGDKKALGFPSIMRQVREHLIRCPATQAVIVLCDHWGPDMLEEHLGDLRAHHSRGVRFLFLMVGTPSRIVAPVAVDFGLAP
jgi:hypothetical protein